MSETQDKTGVRRRDGTEEERSDVEELEEGGGRMNGCDGGEQRR